MFSSQSTLPPYPGRPPLPPLPDDVLDFMTRLAEEENSPEYNAEALYGYLEEWRERPR